MTITAFDGPVTTYGQAIQGQEYNPDLGPSMFDRGSMIGDPRDQFRYLPGQRDGQPNFGWAGWGMIPVLNYVPAAGGAAQISAAAIPVAGTPVALAATNGAITSGQSILRGDTGVLVTGLSVIDAALNPIAYGQGGDGAGGSQRAYNPATAGGRPVTLTFVGNETGNTFTVRGYDIYRMPMTETIAGTTAGTVSGLKAFKYIQSVILTGTPSGSTVSVGTSTTVIGLPMYSLNIGELFVTLAGAVVAAPTYVTGVVAASTASNGDVRGTIAPGTLNGSNRLVVYQTPSPANFNTVAGIVGNTPFANF